MKSKCVKPDTPAAVRRRVFIGTAGWSIPRASASKFNTEGTHLERYSRVLTGAEINSSFHRPHDPQTYRRWAQTVPAGFRFAVKIPRLITHDAALRRARNPLERFLAESGGLGGKRGPLLVQLPPSLEFNPRRAATFFALLRSKFDGEVVCEPRHPSWFFTSAEAMLARHRIARVAADPAPAPGADRPGGWNGIIYYRLHGSPRKYWSQYSPEFVRGLAEAVHDARRHATVWIIFDNTASGAALENAWELHHRLLSR